MKLKVLAQTAVFILLSAGIASAGGRALTCDDCSDECLENPYAKGCPPICADPECQASCNECSEACKKNPYGKGCPDICRDVACQSCSDCTAACKKNPFGETCPDICRDISCYTCDDCSVACIENPDGKDCPPVCDELGCNICDKFPSDCPESCAAGAEDAEDCPEGCQGIPEECLLDPDAPPVPDDDFTDDGEGSGSKALRFIGDLGYLRLSDPADYLFARLGVEYSPFTDTSLEDVSFLALVGAAPKVSGSDGDDALLVDLFAQYNWSESFDGFLGIGLGTWISSGDDDSDSEDTDIDFLANIGARVYGDPDDFNISVFLEARNAVDELDSISEYGRFGIGLRFQQ
ncbi:MAG: hypothetical protein ACL93V_04225 [Candidatus Electrothrix sp. YB6]